MLPLAWLLLSAVSLSADPNLADEGAAASSDAAPLQSGIGQIPEDVLQRAIAVRDAPLPDRISAVSETLLGRPYLSDPLGEGQGHDSDPFARYDAFDCLTFVEEVMALSMAGDPASAASIRNALRYGDGPIRYGTRRHFMELQWIPGNIADGWLRDATTDYGPTVTLERDVTAHTWSNWGRRSLFHLTDEELPIGTMRLDVLTLDEAKKAAPHIRPGSILLTVREDRPWVPLWVTHVGLIVSTDQGTKLRHATKMGSGGTRDHELIWYLDHVATYSNWKTLGVAILEPVEAGPRVSRMPQ